MSNIAVLSGVTPESGDSTTQDYTSSGFGTPTAAIVIFAKATVSETPTSNAAISMGFITADDDMAVSISSSDNLATTSCSRYYSASKALADVDGGVVNRFATGSIITDGIRLVYDGVFADAYHIQVQLIKGTSDVKLVSEAIGLGVHDITSIGFKPTVCFLSTIGFGSPDALATGNLFGFGAVHNDSTDIVKQWYYGLYSGNARVTSLCSSVIRDDSCIGQTVDGVQTWTAVASAFDSQGFTLTTANDALDDDVQILALSFPDPDSIYLGIIDTPTITGVTGTYITSFTPEAYLLYGSVNSSLNTIVTNETGILNSFSVGFVAGSSEVSAGYADQDNLATSNTASYYSDSKGLFCLRSDQNVLYSAGHSSFEGNGLKLDFSTVDTSARKVGLVAFKAEAITPPAGGGGRPVTSRGRILTARDDRKLREKIVVELREVEEVKIDTAALSSSLDIILREFEQEKAVEKDRQEERITQIIRETIRFEHKQRDIKEQVAAIEQLSRDGKFLEALIALLLARLL